MADQQDSKADEDETPDGVGIVRAREILGDLVLRAGYGNERITITRNGKPLAVLIGLKDADRLSAVA